MVSRRIALRRSWSLTVNQQLGPALQGRDYLGRRSWEVMSTKTGHSRADNCLRGHEADQRGHSLKGRAAVMICNTALSSEIDITSIVVIPTRSNGTTGGTR